MLFAFLKAMSPLNVELQTHYCHFDQRENLISIEGIKISRHTATLLPALL